jgi:CRP-like cAMP-binding protein
LIDTQLIAPLIRRWERRCELSDADKQALGALPATIKSFEKEAYLVRDGQPTTHCTILLEGFVYRQKLIRDGLRQIISIHIPGEFIDLQNGLLGVADHGVQSLNRSRVAQIPREALMEMADRHPTIRRAMWLDTLIDASIFREWVVNVGRRNARSRIAHLLCELAARLEAAGMGAQNSYPLPLTQEQLGDATGLTAVHTNRTLQALRREGLVTLTAQSLTVLDWEELREVGDFNERYLHHAV